MKHFYLNDQDYIPTTDLKIFIKKRLSKLIKIKQSEYIKVDPIKEIETILFAVEEE